MSKSCFFDTLAKQDNSLWWWVGGALVFAKIVVLLVVVARVCPKKSAKTRKNSARKPAKSKVAIETSLAGSSRTLCEEGLVPCSYGSCRETTPGSLVQTSLVVEKEVVPDLEGLGLTHVEGLTLSHSDAGDQSQLCWTRRDSLALPSGEGSPNTRARLGLGSCSVSACSSPTEEADRYSACGGVNTNNICMTWEEENYNSACGNNFNLVNYSPPPLILSSANGEEVEDLGILDGGASSSKHLLGGGGETAVSSSKTGWEDPLMLFVEKSTPISSDINTETTAAEATATDSQGAEFSRRSSVGGAGVPRGGFYSKSCGSGGSVGNNVLGSSSFRQTGRTSGRQGRTSSEKKDFPKSPMVVASLAKNSNEGSGFFSLLEDYEDTTA